jgi:hypothetical protein
MARLKIRRTNQYLNRYRSYQIYIDGKRAGSLPNGGTEYFEVSQGKHLVSARSRWGRGPEIKIEISRDEEKYLRLGGVNQTGTVVVIVLIVIFFVLSMLGYFFNSGYKNPLSGLLLLFSSLYIVVFMPKNNLTLKEINTDEVGI